MAIFDAPIFEEMIGADDSKADEVGFSFGHLLKGVGKGIGKAAKGVGKAASSVVKSPIFKLGVGVVAIAFPVVGIPTAAAIASASVTIKMAGTGAAAAAQLNSKITKLKAAAHAGDVAAAHQVNALQAALAINKGKALGFASIRLVASAKGNFSTTPVPLAPTQQPTSLYKPTENTAALALKLAAGGSALGKTVIAAVTAGKSVAVPNGLAVVPGQKPTRPTKLWIGRPPAGTKAREVRGAHIVTAGGFVLSGQAVFVAA